LKNQLKIAQGNNAATLGAASISASAHKAPYDLVAKEKEAIRAELKAKLGREPETTEVLSAYNTALNKTADSSAQARIEKAFTDETKMINLQLSDPNLDKETREKLLAQKKQIYADIVARINAGGPGTQTSAQPAEGAPMYATNGKERIVSTDGGKTWNPVKG
jgi:hypothetical protein